MTIRAYHYNDCITKHARQIILFVCGAVWTAAVVCGVSIYLQQWFAQTHEREYLAIASHRVPALGQSVYAQFIFTQSLALPDLIRVTRLEVPLHIPEPKHALRVLLHQGDREVAAWSTPADTAGTVLAALPLAEPTLLEGHLELSFDGSSISHEDKDIAPRLFTESFDAAYPHGNYRIAQNEKEGDISLTMYEQVSNREILEARYDQQPLSVIADILLRLVGLLVFYMLPFVLFRCYSLSPSPA